MRSFVLSWLSSQTSRLLTRWMLDAQQLQVLLVWVLPVSLVPWSAATNPTSRILQPVQPPLEPAVQLRRLLANR